MSFNVTIVDDNFLEGNETLFGDLTLPSATITSGIQLGSDDEATATILDDELGVTVGFAPTSYTVDENAGSVTLMLVASGPASEGYSVFVNTRDGSATCELINGCHAVHNMSLNSPMHCTYSYR